MNKLRFLVVIFFFALACKSQGPNQPAKTGGNRPDWVQQRPVNSFYYIGIAVVSKRAHPTDFRQIARKQALDELSGEIKVTVSTNSILSQYQNNQKFNQQFQSDIRLSGSETIENFEVVGTWENKEEYWIYCRLSKAAYEEQRRRVREEAKSRSIDFLERALVQEANSQWLNAFKSRVRALVVIQRFLNESMEAEWKGKQIYLVNEIINQLQDQLVHATIRLQKDRLESVVAKALPNPVEFKTLVQGTKNTLRPLGSFPIKISCDDQSARFTPKVETSTDGEGSFVISKAGNRLGIQRFLLQANLEELIKTDSMYQSCRQLLVNLDVPSAALQIDVKPIKVFLQTEEVNQGIIMGGKIIEPAMKKRLTEMGCIFVRNKQDADYHILVKAETTDLGVMWGTMLQAGIEMQIELVDPARNIDVYKDTIRGVKGYQTTKEKAGLDAFNNLLSEMNRRVYPSLANSLF